MIIDNCNHEKVLNHFTKYNGFKTNDDFLNYLLKDDKRLINELT